MNTVPHLKTVSGQSAEIYRLLSKSGSMTAQQIAEELDILPNAVYRVTNKLAQLGMIKKVENYPAEYKANNPNTAMNWYLLAAAQNFREDFNINSNESVQSNDVPKLSFIKDRESLISRTMKDVAQANKSINYIVSGHNVPDDTLLAYRKAIIKGVKIRAIWQEKLEITKRSLEEWKRIGVEVRHGPVLGMRLFIIDSRVVYLISYDLRVHNKAFGIRFDYAPIALQMEKLFEENWQEATAL